MKFIFRWAFRLFILLIVLLVAGILLLDTIVKAAVESRIRKETGMEVKIGSLSVGLISPVFTVENFKLYNTAEFGGSPFLDLPELYVVYDRGSLFSHKIHYKLIRFNLAELNLVQNKQGKTNLRALQDRQKQARHSAGTTKPAEGSGFKFAGIETLNISLGKATLLKMNNPSQPWELKLNVRNKVVTGIKTDEELSDTFYLILLEAGAKPALEFTADAGGAPKSAGKQ